jgi:acyl-coenzyme A synthetase/AMP-(fatty) acid ligase
VCFSVPKIFFAYGFGNSITFPFSVGASSVLLPGQPKPAAIFEAIARYRPTVFFGLPTLYTALSRAPDARNADLSSLRLCVSAAEVLAAEVFNAWKAISGLEVMEGLGSSEVLHIYLSNTPAAKRLGAAGKRVPGYEIALRDADGREVADGEEGILWVRGDSNAPCYWNRPDKTAETMREGGWIYTGDRFVRDVDGFHYFRGRADDLVKISGQWVYPLEVELCLARVRGARRRRCRSAHHPQGRRRPRSAGGRLRRDHARPAGLREGPPAPLQIPPHRLLSRRAAQDRQRQDRPPGPAEAAGVGPALLRRIEAPIGALWSKPRIRT